MILEVLDMILEYVVLCKTLLQSRVVKWVLGCENFMSKIWVFIGFYKKKDSQNIHQNETLLSHLKLTNNNNIIFMIGSLV